MKITKHHRALIALLHVPDMGLQRARILLQKTGVDSAEELFRLRIPDLLRIDGIGERVARNLISFDNWKTVDQIISKTEKAGAGLIAIDDLHYPELLKHIYDPPVILWYKGNREVLGKPGVAVIGTRQPGKYGLTQTEKWVKKLVRAGFCINSGLAYGIDARAHQTAVEHGGNTAAVLGSGIDVLYPAKNKPLAKKILDQGGIILSEYPPGTAPDAINFPGRNRIVSGMSHGVLVAESGIKGGSMITARFALDQNREVFVIPHQLDSMKGEGGNYLIRSGQGKLIQSLSDILDEISVQMDGYDTGEKPVKKSDLSDLNEEERRLCNLLADEALHIDQISEKLGCAGYRLLPLILELEMKGIVKQKPGKYFELI